MKYHIDGLSATAVMKMIEI